MSLSHLKISSNILQPVLAIAFIDFVLLVVLLVMTTTIFATPSGVELKFPYEAINNPSAQRSVIVEITSENVIYVNKRVVTLNELRRLLSGSEFTQNIIFLKAHRHASMGRVADVLELCRNIPGARVNVGTDH
jgi:biopolymer transport protein ExbD